MTRHTAGTTVARDDRPASPARLPATPPVMESATGRVVAVRGDMASVAVSAAFACPRCAAGKGCGAGLLGGGGERLIELRMPPGTAFREGAAVRLVISPRRLLGAAALAYGLPLAGLVLATLACAVAGGSDAVAAMAGLAGLAIALWAGRRRLSSQSACAAYVPVMEPGRD